MNQQITEALSRTGINILKTGAALIVTTVASNHLRNQVNATIESTTQSFQRIRQEFAARRNLGE